MTMIPADDFISYLGQLAAKNRGALSAVRRGASFTPGTYSPAFPYVERFIPEDEHAQGHRRVARYLVATLFALHPKHAQGTTLASAFGHLMRERDSASLEKRFVALIGTGPDELPTHLRHVISLLAADQIELDYAALEKDLVQWLNPFGDESRERVRQQWARHFYRALAPQQQTAPTDSD